MKDLTLDEAACHYIIDPNRLDKARINGDIDWTRTTATDKFGKTFYEYRFSDRDLIEWISSGQPVDGIEIIGHKKHELELLTDHYNGDIGKAVERWNDSRKHRLKEAREVSEVRLSDLDPEEWEDCKGMWVLGEYYNGEIFEGIIFSFYQDDVLVRIPKDGMHHWRRPDQLILLPDHQRAFSPDGGPVKVDHGQWEKTREMEEEFDRLKAEEDSTTRVVAYGGLAVREVMEAASEAGTPIVEAQFTGNGGVTLFFAKKDGGDD